MKMKWKFVDFKKLVGLGRDVETFMITLTQNIGKRFLEKIEEVKEIIGKRQKGKRQHIN